jgi:hypothetical protein
MRTIDHRAPPRRQLREKAVEQDIKRNLETLGFFVSKTSQPGKPVGMTLGIPDLYAVHARWRLRFWIEVKEGGNKPTLHQLAWHQEERAAGGTVLVAWSWGEVLDEIIRMGAPITR